MIKKFWFNASKRDEEHTDPQMTQQGLARRNLVPTYQSKEERSQPSDPSNNKGKSRMHHVVMTLIKARVMNVVLRAIVSKEKTVVMLTCNKGRNT